MNDPPALGPIETKATAVFSSFGTTNNDDFGTGEEESDDDKYNGGGEVTLSDR